MNQHGGGVMVYTHGLLQQLLALDSGHEFVLIYRDEEMIGRYGDYPNVREIAVPARSLITWDQWAAPRAAKREGVDLLFNPKYSLPLMTSIPGSFVCHGLDWYVMPQWSKFTDRLSHKHLIPRYAKKARRIIAVSETARGHLNEYLGVPLDRIDTVHLGLDEDFRAHLSDPELAQARERFKLPQRYLLYCGQIYPPKNFGRLVEAYARVAKESDVDLVVAGTHTFLCEEEIASIDQLGLSDRVHRLGWVDHDQLPALYRMADALVMPSLYEACPSPPLEAMACDCPVVTANRHGTAEIAGDAARLVDPESVESIAEGILDVLNDETLRATLIQRGRERQAAFTWRRCAEQTLASLERAAAG